MFTQVFGTPGKAFVCLAADGSASVLDTSLVQLAPRLTIEVDYPFGRVALSRDAERLYTAHHEEHGIRCHDVRSGRCLWARPDLAKQGTISLGHGDTVLLCGMLDPPAFVLDASTGATCASLDAEGAVWADPDGPATVWMSATYAVLYTEPSRKLTLAPHTTGILSAAFTPELLWLSEVQGRLRCFERSTGAARLEVRAPRGSHFLQVSVHRAGPDLRALAWSYEHGGPCRLFAIDGVTGRTRELAAWDEPGYYAFVGRGEYVVTSSGVLWNAAHGALLGRFPAA